MSCDWSRGFVDLVDDTSHDVPATMCAQAGCDFSAFRNKSAEHREARSLKQIEQGVLQQTGVCASCREVPQLIQDKKSCFVRTFCACKTVDIDQHIVQVPCYINKVSWVFYQDLHVHVVSKPAKLDTKKLQQRLLRKEC
jgi:hypothetical protein